MRGFPLPTRIGARFAWLWHHRHRFRETSQAVQPRLLVDVSAIIRHDAQTGIQRVVRAVWSELQLHEARDFELVPVYAAQSHGYCYAPMDFLDTPVVRGTSDPVQARFGDKFLGLDLSAHILPKWRQQLRVWRSHGATVHLVVYDLLPILSPQWFNSKATAHFHNWFSVIAEDTDQAICISNQVARDLRERLRQRSGASTVRIVNMSLGGDIAKSLPSEGLCDDVLHLVDRLRFRPAILMVGTIEPRKAYHIALEAFEYLWRNRGGDAPDLVIVGKPGWKTKALQRRLRTHPEYGKRLHWLDGVTDEGLSLLYESCRGLFVASLGEGFGLPLAEALAHGRYVLARDLPVFREQNLPNTLFFDDDHPAALAEQLMELTRIGAMPTLPKIETPTWEDSVKQLLEKMDIPATTASVHSLSRAVP